MTKTDPRLLAIAIILVIGLTGCASPPAPQQSPSPGILIEPALNLEEPVAEAPEAGDLVIPEEVPQEEEHLPPEEEEPVVYVPSEVEYVRTFEEVERIIEDLNRIIRNQEYDSWLPYLSDDYLRSISNTQFLASVSERPVLKNRGIVLSSPKDYFSYVVVPSRANLRLDDLVFKSDREVEAVMILGETRITLYHLILIDALWKIGSF